MHECAKDRHIFRKILSHRVPAVSLRQRRTAASEQRGDWPAITCACATRAILNPSPVISPRSSVHGLSHRLLPNETVCRITLLLTSTPCLINKPMKLPAAYQLGQFSGQSDTTKEERTL